MFLLWVLPVLTELWGKLGVTWQKLEEADRLNPILQF